MNLDVADALEARVDTDRELAGAGSEKLSPGVHELEASDHGHDLGRRVLDLRALALVAHQLIFVDSKLLEELVNVHLDELRKQFVLLQFLHVIESQINRGIG